MMEALIAAIAAIGAALVVLLGIRLRQLNQAVSLKSHRSNAEGMVDRLNYASVVDDGIIINKNGSFMAAFIYRGADDASSTETDREVVSYRINQALAELGDGWVLHVDAVRQEAPNYIARGVSAFPDPITAAIDEERRRYFERLGSVYEGYFVATFTYYPPMLSQAKFIELMFDDDRQTVSASERNTELLDKFKLSIAKLESRLSVVFKMERLRGIPSLQEDGQVLTHDAFLRFLQSCVTGKNHPVALPDMPVYLDAIVGNEEFWGGVIPKIGRKFVQVVAIDGLPSHSYPGILSALAGLPVNYRWSTRFIFVEPHVADALLNKLQKKWQQKMRGFFDQLLNRPGPIDEDAAEMVADASGARAEVKGRQVAAGFYTSVVVLMDEDRDVLMDCARFVETRIAALGFGARIETINNMDAYFGSLPGHAVENIRRPLIHSMNLADLMPTSSIWTGEGTAPCPHYPADAPPLMQCVTTGNSVFRFNLHVRDLGHTAVFGPTRAGKSTFLGLLAAQARRYPDMQLHVFEKGLSMYALCQAAGGNHISVAGEGAAGYCPLGELETKNDRAWAMEWIDTLLALNDVKTTPAQRVEVGKAILSMHESGSKTMTDFCASVQDQEIREALKPYTLEGLMGHLIDAKEDGLSVSNFNVYEIGELMGLGERFALPVLLYLFRRVEKSLRGQPAIIVLDEAWLMLGHAAFRARIRDWLKTLAKLNCSVVLATQNLSDAKASGILDVIVESTATKVFLPNAHAANEEFSGLYKTMGLNETQIKMLAHATPKQDYYAVSEQGNRMFQLALGPVSLAFVAVSDLANIGTINELRAHDPANWPYQWAALKGADLGAYVDLWGKAA